MLMETASAGVQEPVRRIFDEKIAGVFLPVSVYRLQLNRFFTFEDAGKILPYLREIGVDAVYTSPFFKAVPGSLHGYDIVNPREINPELGRAAAYENFSAALKSLGLQHIIDVVPNHMSVSSENALWTDVLESGRESVYAGFFDIDWDPPKKELKNKVLLPVLEGPYGKMLKEGKIALVFSEGSFFARYAGRFFPLNPVHVREIFGETKLEDRVHRELEPVLMLFDALSVPGRVPEKLHEEKKIAKLALRSLYLRSETLRAHVETRLSAYNAEVFPRLYGLLEKQSYRLAFWKVASEEINYRRFFNINELAAVRMEDENVFEYCHGLVYELLRQGRIHGLRIDHPDGLYEPAVYFRRLQKKYLVDAAVAQAPLREKRAVAAEAEKLWKERYQGARPLYVVTEKILNRKESLREDWPVYGTVGYDFLSALNGLFVDRDNQAAISGVYENFIGHPIEIDQLIYDAKILFIDRYLASEANMLGYRLDAISELNPFTRDFTLNDLTRALKEVIACFPIYRTYIQSADEKPGEDDRRSVEIAVARAKSRNRRMDASVFDFLRSVLLLEFPEAAGAEETALYRDFVLRFQQVTAPIMAKGVEDTAFYVNHRLISLNEVGGDPAVFGITVSEFHRGNAERAKKWPYGFLMTSSHDTKRSEDARQRVNVLSEIPDEWKSRITQWAVWNQKHKTLLHEKLEPRPNTEYFIYQTLLCVWPETSPPPVELELLLARLWEAVRKSIREAKIYTDWISPDESYEHAVEKFIRGILTQGDNAFLRDFEPFCRRISKLGKLNSLSSLTLKCASPGAVDTYQGDEIWNYSLVDPDNRRHVDFESRKKALQALPPGISPGIRAEDAKLHFLRQALRLRKEMPALFLEAEYFPLQVRGSREKNAVAIGRKKDGRSLVALAGRFFSALPCGTGDFPEPSVWGDTAVFLPEDMLPSGSLKDIYTGRVFSARRTAEGYELPLQEVFGCATAAMLLSE